MNKRVYIHLMAFFSTTTWVSQHQKGKPFWILLEQEMMEWRWQQLDNMQIVCTSLQTDNHASTSPFSFYRPDALPAAQPTASKHWRFTWKMVVKTLFWLYCWRFRHKNTLHDMPTVYSMFWWPCWFWQWHTSRNSTLATGICPFKGYFLSIMLINYRTQVCF